MKEQQDLVERNGREPHGGDTAHTEAERRDEETMPAGQSPAGQTPHREHYAYVEHGVRGAAGHAVFDRRSEHSRVSLTLCLSLQPCASHPARTGAPAAGPSSACAAQASAEPAAKRSFRRRNSTPRTPGQHPDARSRDPPACAGAVWPEKAPRPERGPQRHSCSGPGKSPSSVGPPFFGGGGVCSLSWGASAFSLFGEDLGGEGWRDSPPLPQPHQRGDKQVCRFWGWHRLWQTGLHGGGGRGAATFQVLGERRGGHVPGPRLSAFKSWLPLPRWVTLGKLLTSLIPH